MVKSLCLGALGRSIEKFGDMISTPKFWYIIIALVGVIILIINCLKHPKVGKWVLFAVFYLGFLCLTAYSCVQLSIHYKTRGGIFGQITGIFEPNQVQIVDDITYEFTNTELVQVDDTNRYSSNAIVQEVMDLEKGVKYQLLVNGVPCGYSDNNEDYIIAKYNYIFYDENFDILKQDVLTIKIAFYTNSTSFSVSTDGGASAVKYWNYYFNKNNFIVTLTSKSVEKDDEYTTGDISNFIKLTYISNGEVYKEKTVLKGSEIDLSTPDIDKFEYWTINGEKVTSAKATRDTVITAYITPEYSCDFVVLDNIEKTVVVNKGEILDEYKPTISINNTTKYVVDYWTVEGVKVDLSTYTVDANTTLVAQGHYQYAVALSFYYTDLSTVSYWVDENAVFSTKDKLESNYVITKCTVNGVDIDANSYIVTQPITIIAEGYLQYELTFVVDKNIYETMNIKLHNSATSPNNPVVEGKEFLGWSLDGVTIIEDMSSELADISQNKTYIAMFKIETRMLTIKDGYNGDIISQISQNVGTTYTLEPSVVEGKTFVGWKIESGNGIINGNTFTFTGVNCVVYPYYSTFSMGINSASSYSGTYNGEQIDVFDAGSFVGNERYSSDLTVSCNDSITITCKNLNSSITISTDGEYTQTGSISEGLTFTWQKASYFNIEIVRENMV